MQSRNQEQILNIKQKSIMIFFISLIIISIFTFKNLLFQPTILLKSFGDSSIQPTTAFENNKPTFLEFYAEWCEVCKEMAPKVSTLKAEYEDDINFVFLNVDNPKWEKYIRRFNVNGIPQINLLSSEENLEATFIGKQAEKTIKDSLENLISKLPNTSQIIASGEMNEFKKNKIYPNDPRSHG